MISESKGFGVIAMEDIPPKTFICEYIGECYLPGSFKNIEQDYTLSVRE